LLLATARSVEELTRSGEKVWAFQFRKRESHTIRNFDLVQRDLIEAHCLNNAPIIGQITTPISSI
ncbi:MAG: hypothetical protein AB8A67_10520, partial [Prochlorococcus sp.]